MNDYRSDAGSTYGRCCAYRPILARRTRAVSESPSESAWSIARRAIAYTPQEQALFQGPWLSA